MTLLRQLLTSIGDRENGLNVHLIKQFTQKLVSCLQLATKRVKEIMSDRLAGELAECVDCISKEAHFLMVAFKMVASWPTSSQAVELLNISSSKIIGEMVKLEKIIMCKDADEYYQTLDSGRKSISATAPLAHYQLIRNQVFSEPLAAQWKKSASETRVNIHEFMNLAKAIIGEKNGITLL